MVVFLNEMRVANNMRPGEEADILNMAERDSSLFFVGIIYTGDDEKLRGTLNSVFTQPLAGSRPSIHIFHSSKNPPQPGMVAGTICVPFLNEDELFRKFVYVIGQSVANYYTVMWNGEEFFSGAFDAAQKILEKYDEINWLTGIQTIRAINGFNITLGNTAIRRWSYKIYERNLYKKSGRYIPPGSTFWRKSAWDSVSPHLHFVSLATFFEDMWLAFFKSQKLYTCKIYFSTTHSYQQLGKLHLKQPNNYTPIEDDWTQRMLEFFFINNIPYLRLLYRATSKLTPIIRFDHSTQSYFLSKY